MRISVLAKIVIGLLTAWIVISPFLFITAWFFTIFSVASTQTQSPSNPSVVPLIILPIIFLVICTSILDFCLKAFYIVHIILNRTGGDFIRSALGVGMIFIAALAMPVYYLIYILPENPPKWALVANSS